MSVRTKQSYSVVDLGFGDSGKGTITDFLVRHTQAHTVVRFNGGAQAGHHVVTPEGSRHIFAQFGSGTFVPGVKTYLTRYMVVHLGALFVEEKHLQKAGVSDALSRLYMERDCLLITPFQQSANRIREYVRGQNRHGSCGVGVGETVQDSLIAGSPSVYARDLLDKPVLLRKLKQMQALKCEELRSLYSSLRDDPVIRDEIEMLEDTIMPEIIYEQWCSYTKQLTIVDSDCLKSILEGEGCVIWEGAQGVLLDEWHGFHPYTTWSTTTTENVLRLLSEHRYTGDWVNIGVLRTYYTRHGHGPFPTEDVVLSNSLSEETNVTHPWQGPFRCGWFDSVLARYAIGVCPNLHEIALTHLDVFPNQRSTQFCVSYSGMEYSTQRVQRSVDGRITDIVPSFERDLSDQEELTNQLSRAVPNYAMYEALTTDQYCHMIEELVGKRVSIRSWGKTAREKTITRPL